MILSAYIIINILKDLFGKYIFVVWFERFVIDMCSHVVLAFVPLAIQFYLFSECIK